MEASNLRLISCLVIFLVTGCLAEPVVHRPERDIADSQSAKFLKEIESVAEEGDWIVDRGYHAGDVLVWTSPIPSPMQARAVKISLKNKGDLFWGYNLIRVYP